MILFYRSLPFFVGLFSLAAFVALWKTRGLPLSLAAVLAALAASALLLREGTKTPGRWGLYPLPVIFLLSAFVSVLFLQSPFTLLGFGIAVSVILFLYHEHIFFYLLAPARYRAYALEYLSMLMALLSVFSVGMALFGLRMFLQTSVILLCVLFALASVAIVCTTLWSSKFDSRAVRMYGLALALLLSEAFVVLLFLPTGFYTNAALLAVFFYGLLGLTRAHLLKQLSTTVARRYLLTLAGLFLLICLSARWI